MAVHQPKSTQEVAQGRSALRTGIQSFVAALVGFFGIAPLVINTFVPGVADLLPEGWAAWLLGLSAGIAAISAAAAKVMALPGFNDWLRKHKILRWLSPTNPGGAGSLVFADYNPDDPQDRTPGPDHRA